MKFDLIDRSQCNRSMNCEIIFLKKFVPVIIAGSTKTALSPGQSVISTIGKKS